MDMRRATDAAMDRLRLMGCPDPEAYVEEAMLTLIGAEVERVIFPPVANDTHRSASWGTEKALIPPPRTA